MRHALERPRIFLTALGLLALATLGARPARAQANLVSAPTPPWLQPSLPDPQLARPALLGGEPSSAGWPSPWVLSSPLRLSLQNGIFPFAPLFSNCGSVEDSPGYAAGGIAMQRYTFLPLAPRLTLHGFSSGGCAVDGALGGGVTYEMPLRPNLSLVAGAGVYGVPGHAPLPARTQSGARVDLIKQLDAGRSIGVGVGVQRGTPSVSVGGSW